MKSEVFFRRSLIVYTALLKNRVLSIQIAIALIMVISLLPILLHTEQVKAKPLGKTPPIWRDLGLSAAQIGLLIGVTSYGVGTLGALVGGLTVNFLDRKRLLIAGSCFQIVVISAFLLPTWGFNSLVILCSLGIIFHGTSGFTETATSTIKMDYCDRDSAGRYFTIQTSIAFVISLLSVKER